MIAEVAVDTYLEMEKQTEVISGMLYLDRPAFKMD